MVNFLKATGGDKEVPKAGDFAHFHRLLTGAPERASNSASRELLQILLAVDFCTFRRADILGRPPRQGHSSFQAAADALRLGGRVPGIVAVMLE